MFCCAVDSAAFVDYVAGDASEIYDMAVLAKDVRKPTGLRCFFRAYFDGVALKVYEKQGSSHFSASTEANAYVELPEDDSVVTAGTAVQAILI